MSTGRTYPQATGGKWWQPVRRGFRFACCDCGLVHDMDFRVVNGRAQFRPSRNNRATAARRRAPRYKRLKLVTNARKLPK